MQMRTCTCHVVLNLLFSILFHFLFFACDNGSARVKEQDTMQQGTCSPVQSCSCPVCKKNSSNTVGPKEPVSCGVVVADRQ